jgi:hypothetical protein
MIRSLLLGTVLFLESISAASAGPALERRLVLAQNKSTECTRKCAGHVKVCRRIAASQPAGRKPSCESALHACMQRC